MNPVQQRKTRYYFGLVLAVAAVIAGFLVGTNVIGDNNKPASAESSFDASSVNCDDVNDVRAAIVKDDTLSQAEKDARIDAVNTKCEAEAKECPNTWMIVQADNGNNRWFASGVQAIREADSPEKAREAAREWLNLVRQDPELLAGAGAYFTGRQVDPATLVEGKCASAAAETLVTEIELAIAEAKVTPDQAPENGRNSGVSDGNVVASSHTGITGDRQAVRVELKDGTVIWIMARCGNPVIEGPAPVPPGPTDQPPPETPPTTTPPTTVPPTTPPPTVPPPKEKPKCPYNPALPPDHPNCLKPKDPSKDVLVNPKVPDQVKGPGTTPVGTDPGPARPPVDSPTGCNGPCDEDDGFDPPTTTTPPAQPPSTPPPTVPSCGQHGQPSCGNTGITPPTTVAPPSAPPVTESPTVTVPSP